MNIQELPKNQSIGFSIWEVHDYVKSLINDVMEMQDNPAPPVDAWELLERLEGAQHPMDIGKLIKVLKKLEYEMKILGDQTRQTEKEVHEVDDNSGYMGSDYPSGYGYDN
tara:strand:+ start:313 stop:642 length:330 start_codon:yes stop_codon:yes gene_type:complete